MVSFASGFSDILSAYAIWIALLGHNVTSWLLFA
jgi:hypothetical protein